MKKLLAGAGALGFLLAGCTAQQATNVDTGVAAAAAVVTDLVTLEQQVQASGTTVSPQELADLNKAIADASAGVTQLAGGTSSAASVMQVIQADLVGLEPFIPAIVSVVSSLAAQPVAAPSYPVIPQLAHDFANLRKVAG